MAKKDKSYKVVIDEKKYRITRNKDEKPSKQVAKLTGLSTFKKAWTFNVVRNSKKKNKKAGKLAKVLFFSNVALSKVLEREGVSLTEKEKNFLLERSVKIENEKFNAKVGEYLIPETAIYAVLQKNDAVSKNFLKSLVEYRKTIK